MALRVAEFNPINTIQDSKYNAVPVNNANNFIFNKLKEDIDRLDCKTNPHSHTDQALLYALSPLPPARRIGSLPDTLEEKNYLRAGLLLSMAAANFPGDLREIGIAIKNPFQKNSFQHELSLFRGTFLKRFLDNPFIEKIDKTLFSTKFGEKIMDTVKIEIDDLKSIKGPTPKTVLKAFKFSGNGVQKLIGNSLLRIPILGVAFGGLLELPAIIKSVTDTKGSALEKGKSLSKQLIKSAGYVGLSTLAIGIGGALLFPHGAILGLIGMGVGSSIALVASKALNKQVDKLA
ncbi:MAG TPA: hypothetical protein P5556_00860 [Candidatus Gastranaerophilales bacterium]|nr:hypothetical protein [Candidatus Gastranaerophilales bacterium]